MENKVLNVDDLAKKFGNDISDYIRNWMRGLDADDMDFHKYRMRLLSYSIDAKTVTERLIMLAEKTSTKLKFDIVEATCDKIMGDSVARYIFARIMITLNETYSKILEYESDRVKSEINVLRERTLGLKTRIGQH